MQARQLHEHDSQGGKEASQVTQYSTFKVAGRYYGINVKQVQEVVRPLRMTKIPLADNHIKGLINLRGQVATAIGLRELFGIESSVSDDLMNVVCKCDDHLVSLLVDEIGDVIEVERQHFEETPPTIPKQVRKYVNGVYKLKGSLLSIIDVDEITRRLKEQG